MILDNYYIDNEKIYSILLSIRSKLNNKKLAVIENKGTYIRVTCPFHKNGTESHPSCGILISENSVVFNCFSCGKKGDFVSFVAACLDCTYQKSKEYLINNFGQVKNNNIIKIDNEICVTNYTNKQYFLDELLLENFEHYCEYFKSRNLSELLCEKFKLRFDKKNNKIILPVWDKFGHYIGNIRRDIHTHFYSIELPYKPLYLLNYVIKNKIKTVFITEGQIDALTLFEYGKVGIATLGQPNYKQIQDINKSGIRTLIAAFDNDTAGRKMITFLHDNLSQDILYQVLVLPKGKKDINECTKEEVEKCTILNYEDWLKLCKEVDI